MKLAIRLLENSTKIKIRIRSILNGFKHGAKEKNKKKLNSKPGPTRTVRLPGGLTQAVNFQTKHTETKTRSLPSFQTLDLPDEKGFTSNLHLT